MAKLTKKPKKDPSWRLTLTKLFFLGLAAATLGKLFYIQLFQHKQYTALAEGQHWLKQKIPGRRGNIMSSDGYPLADNQEAHDFYIDMKILNQADVNENDLPESQEPLDYWIEKLSQIFLEHQIWQPPEDEEDKAPEPNTTLKEQMKNKSLGWLLVESQVPLEVKQKLQDQIPGSYFQRHDRRYYPENTLASHLLGFVGADAAGEDAGYFGLEGFYNGDLSGKLGWVSLEKDAFGNPLPLGEYFTVTPQDGSDLLLTLNRELQYLLEKKLKDGVKKYGAKSGSFILMSPRDGAILALANFPTHNPGNREESLFQNDSEEQNLEDILFNRAIAQSYEPGSVLKVITMSAALEEEIVEPDTVFDCSGPLTIQGHQIRTWNNQYHGPETMAEILQHSCNVGAAWLSQHIGLDIYLKYLNKFELGQTTEVDLEGETAGIVKTQDSWQAIDLATAAFGQGISVSPLQLTTVFATLANDGVKTTPHLADRIIQKNKEIDINPVREKRVLSTTTTHKLKSMLQDVVEKGEFKWFVKQAGMDKFAIAGKTGTAQIPRGGGYDPNQTNVTFVGFAPAQKPAFVLLVKLEEPTSSTYSADTAVPLWLEMAKDLVLYFGISPK